MTRSFARFSRRFNAVDDSLRSAAADQISSTRDAYFRDWASVWEYADAETTARRLTAAGFIDVVSTLESAPTTLADERSYREFVTTVIFHPHLARLPEGHLRGLFIDLVTAQAAQQDPPFTLDYWRLNMEARRP